LKLDPTVVTQKVAYHDPCNIARAGWIVEQPREILKAICPNFIEMGNPGRENICCGGGGGTVSIDETYPYRMEIGGKAKAQQIIESGAEIVIAPCANCKKQIKELINYHKINVELMGLHDLIYKAIIFPEAGETIKTEGKEV